MQTKRVVITGGTNGLGHELVVQFLERGWEVISIGRTNGHDNHRALTFYNCDFTSLVEVKNTGQKIISMGGPVHALVNNAGILSPPEFAKTPDGFEKSYQVNFLAHVFLFDILSAAKILNDAIIVNTTSPIRTLGGLATDWISDKKHYGMWKAYASTKLYMELFARRLAANGFTSYAFDPGTFRSGIYRAQKPWFHHLYKVGGPFLVSSKNVALDFMHVFEGVNRQHGVVYNRKGKIGKARILAEYDIADFWERVTHQLQNHSHA